MIKIDIIRRETQAWGTKINLLGVFPISSGTQWKNHLAGWASVRLTALTFFKKKPKQSCEVVFQMAQHLWPSSFMSFDALDVYKYKGFFLGGGGVGGLFLL